MLLCCVIFSTCLLVGSCVGGLQLWSKGLNGLVGVDIDDGVFVVIWWCCAMQHSIYTVLYRTPGGFKLGPW